MHAIRLQSYGPAENLIFDEVDDPEPGPEQVRVTVAAAGVHLLDVSQRQGDPDYALLPLPGVLGREIAGVVDAVGEGGDPAWLGRPVVAHVGFGSNGGYAERTLCDVSRLHDLPDGLDAAEAVAMIGTGRTALGILDIAKLVPDDVVLVTAAAGGLGCLFVQAAHNIGATVVGTAGGPAKVAEVQRLGADVAVDYLLPGWDTTVRAALGKRGVTVALDGVGGEAGRQAFELLAVGGRHVLFGWSSGKKTEMSSDDLYERLLTVTVALGPRVLQRPGGLRSLEDEALAEVAARRLVPTVQRFPLADAAAAHTALETRRTVGTVVLIP
jgi:NADPH2:quinone reductase